MKMVNTNIKYHFPNNYDRTLDRLLLLRKMIFRKNPNAPGIVGEIEQAILESLPFNQDGLYFGETMQEHLENPSILRMESIEAIDRMICQQRLEEVFVK